MNKIAIKPDIDFWHNCINAVKKFSPDALIIVPTANHIPLFEQNWAKQQDTNYGDLPRAVTLAHVLEEYNIEHNFNAPYKQYLDLYQFFKKQSELWEKINIYDLPSRWQFIKVISDACKELSEKYLYQVNFYEEVDLSKQAIYLQQCIDKEYTQLSKKIIDIEAQILLNIWQYTINLEYLPFSCWQACKEFALKLTQPLIYIAFDEIDTSLWHITQNINQDLLVITMDWKHELETIFPEQQSLSLGVLKDNKIDYDINDFYYNFKHKSIEIVECITLENCAAYTLYSILEDFKNNLNNIGLIAQDRVALRRIKTLMTFYKIPMADETGWKISTTMLATCIKNWLDIVQFEKFNYKWLLEYDIFPTQDLNYLQIYDNKPISKIQDNKQWSQNFWQQIKLWQNIHNLENWQKIWYQWCDWLGLDIFSHDVDNLSNHINKFCISDSYNNYSSSEWIFFLLDILEQSNIASLYDISMQKVHILALNGSRLRTFDKIYFIGSDDKHLPSSSEHSLFLNENIRTLLGLETKFTRFAKQSRDLLQLIYSQNNIRFIYQKYNSDNIPQNLSRWLAKLLRFSNVTYLTSNEYSDKIYESNAIQLENTIKYPRLQEFNINNLGAYDCIDLLTCQYKWYLKKIKKIPKYEIDKNSSILNYGTWVHDILYKSHLAKSNNPDKDFKQLAYYFSNQAFSIELDAYALDFKYQWITNILPNYIIWQSENENSFNQWLEGEYSISLTLETIKPVNISIKIDRIDINHTNKTINIIDYKLKTSKSIDKSQNTQLFLYNYLYAQHLQKQNKYSDYSIEVSFLNLKDKPIKLYSPFAKIQQNNIQEELNITSSQLIEEITTVINNIQQHNEIKANPTIQNCRNCDYKYMCEYTNSSQTEIDEQIEE